MERERGEQTPDWRRLAACLGAALLAFAMCSSRARGLLLNTAKLTAGASLIALPVGAIWGLALAKVETRGRQWLYAVTIGAMFVPLQVYAAAWQTLLGFKGWSIGAGPAGPWLDGWLGAAWVHGWAAAPWAALLCSWGFGAVERRLEEDALLDASAARVLVRVTMRRAPGGMLAALLLTATTCAAEIAVTDLFRVRSFAEEVYTQAALGSLSGGLGEDADAAALADARDLLWGCLLHASIGVAALAAAAPLLPRPSDAESRLPWRVDRRTNPRLASGLAAAAWLAAATAVAAPAAGLAWKAGLNYGSIGSESAEPRWSLAKTLAMLARVPRDHGREIAWSVGVGAAAAAGALVVAVGGAMIARNHGELRRLAGAVLAALAATPGPLVGVATIAALAHAVDSPWSWLTPWYNDTPLAPWTVQFLRALPLVGLAAWMQLASVPQDLLDAAASEGVPSWRRTLAIAVPLRAAGLVGAGLCGLAVAVNEVSATLLVYPPGTTPLSVRISQLLHYGVDDRVAALALAVLLATMLLAVIVVRFASREGAAPAEP